MTDLTPRIALMKTFIELPLLRRMALPSLALGLALLAGACSDDNNIVGPNPTATATPPAGTTATATPPAGTTATPTPPVGNTPTPTPPAGGATATVDVGPGGGNAFVDRTSGNSTTTINAGDTVEWIWQSGFHSTTSGTG